MKIIETLTLGICDDGFVHELAVGFDKGMANILDKPIASVTWNETGFNPLAIGGKIAQPDEVVDIVCKHFGYTREQLESKSRKRELVTARHLAIYFLRHKTKMSHEDIGDLMGGRDHTTSISAVQSVCALMDSDDAVRKYAYDLSKKMEHLYNVSPPPAARHAKNVRVVYSQLKQAK